MSIHKLQVEDGNFFEGLRTLHLECKKNQEVPTQIILGSKAYKELIKNDTFKSNLYISDSNMEEIYPGFIGKLTDIDLLTDYYVDKDNLPWSIEENEIVFNVGNKLSGKI